MYYLGWHSSVHKLIYSYRRLYKISDPQLIQFRLNIQPKHWLYTDYKAGGRAMRNDDPRFPAYGEHWSKYGGISWEISELEYNLLVGHRNIAGIEYIPPRPVLRADT